MPRGVSALAPPYAPAGVRKTVPQLDDLRTFVTCTRTHPTDYGQRQVFVRIDEGERVALLHGQSITLELRPGTHVLRAHNTLFRKTIEFRVESGEHVEFMIINRGGPWVFTAVALLGAAPLFLTIERRMIEGQ